MNWKQFMKLNRNKIIIFLLFTLLAFIRDGIPFSLGISLGILLFPGTLLYYFLGFEISASFFGLAVITLIDLFFLYIISCLIAWIYDKFNKKWLFIVFLISIFILASIIVPKECGIIPVMPPVHGGSKCQCIGHSYEDWSGTPLDRPAVVYCIGICHSCQVRYP